MKKKKYWKCVNMRFAEYFTVGKIYEQVEISSNKGGIFLCNNKGNVMEIVGNEMLSFEKCNPEIFPKSLLKSGMLLLMNDGRAALVFMDSCIRDYKLYKGESNDVIVFNEHLWDFLDSYDDNLVYKNGICDEVTEGGVHKHHVVKIMSPNLPIEFLKRTPHLDKSFDVIWEKNGDVPEYTMSQLEDILGHNFKIKK